MTSNFDLILPYVKSLAPLLADEEISEIMVNASGAVFIEREGRLSAIDGVVIAERQRQGDIFAGLQRRAVEIGVMLHPPRDARHGIVPRRPTPLERRRHHCAAQQVHQPRGPRCRRSAKG